MPTKEAVQKFMETRGSDPDAYRNLLAEMDNPAAEPFPGRKIVKPRAPLPAEPSPDINWGEYGKQAFGMPIPGKPRQFAFSPVLDPSMDDKVAQADEDIMDGDEDDEGKVAKKLFKVEDKSIDVLKKRLAQYEKKDSKIDWTPLLALTDSWTGSQLARNYDKPMDDEEREDVIFRFKTAIKEKEADLSFKQSKIEEYSANRIQRREEKRLERKLRLDIAELHAQGKERKSAAAEHRLTTSLYKSNKAAVDQLANDVMIGKQGEEQFESFIPLINNRLYEIGKEWEDNEHVEPGQGYYKAIEQINKAKGSSEEDYQKILQAYSIPGWDLPQAE